MTRKLKAVEGLTETRTQALLMGTEVANSEKEADLGGDESA
jgi:hypothetical protein